MKRSGARARTAAIAIALIAASPAPARTADLPHLLLFSGTYGFRHAQIEHMAEVVEQIGQGSFTVEHTEDPTVFTPALYDRVDAIFFLQVTGTPPFNAQQRADLLRFIGCGAGFIGVHASTDSGADWPEYTQMIGARFAGHPHQGRDALGGQLLAPISEVTINVEDGEHPATAPWRGQETFRFDDEIYRYQEDPRAVPGLNVLLSIDANSDYWPLAPVPNPRRYAGELSPWLGYTDVEPVAWTKTHGDGRVFYTNLGHNPTTWDDPAFREHLAGGIAWATQQRATPDCL